MAKPKRITAKPKRTISETGSSSLRGVFLFVSVIFTLTMSFLVIWQIVSKGRSVHEFQLELIVPNDSSIVEKVLIENDAQIKELIRDLNAQSQEITDKYELLLKSQETESDFFRFVSAIAAFVVALLGFLGYKTIKDIELKAQSMAESKAEKTAEETAQRYTSTHLEQEVEKQMSGIVKDSTASRLIREQITKEFIDNYIRPLEEKFKTIKKSAFIQGGYEEIEVDDGNAFDQNNPEIDIINNRGEETDE